MIKGLIFDLDGTLIDSIKDITTSVNLSLKEYGFKEVSLDFVRKNTGRGFRVLVQDSLSEVKDDKLIDEITDLYTAKYGEHYKDETNAYEGIKETLTLLQEKGIKLAVNSNKKDIYTKSLMKKIFPNIDFIAVYGEREGIKNKPDPTSANEIVDIMKLDKQEVLYVGDSEVDIRTAKNANLKSIGCKWGFRKEQVLIEEGATYIIDKPQEMIDIIERSKR